jgi:hypothetical protein
MTVSCIPAAVAGVLLATVATARATDINVPGDQPTIQQAIAAAADGDRVLVSPGTYPEHIDFLGKAIQVLSTDGSAVTVIDGTQTGTVVTFRSGEPRTALLAGFTIRGGRAPDGSNGGGILIDHASPSVMNNEVFDNAACNGGGLEATQGSPLIAHNRFHHNRANCGSSANGAGLDIESPVETLVAFNLIDANSRAEAGGGVALTGLGHATLDGNVIRENQAFGAGGGIFSELSHLRLENNVVVSNSEQGIFADILDNKSVLDIVNNTVADNVELEMTIQARHGNLKLYNNIIRTTQASFTIGCGFDHTGTALVSHNLIFSTNGAHAFGNCDLSDGLIDADPLFSGAPGAHAYWLTSASPAIDAGDNTFAARIRHDATGNARVINGTVDLGAFEFRGN